MPPYSLIVVALDGSDLAEQILRLVEPLAHKFRSAVILLRATLSPEMAVPAIAATGGLPALEPMPIVEADRAESGAYLEAVADRLRGQGLDVVCEYPEGHAAPAIVERSRQLGVELIAMTTHGRGGLGRLIFGSVADEVLRTASCPILLLRIGEAAG